MTASITQTSLNVAVYAHNQAPDGADVALCGAILSEQMRNYSDFGILEAMAQGDEDAYDLFLRQTELQGYVGEVAGDVFADLARNELAEREEGVKSAWEREVELRAAVGVV